MTIYAKNPHAEPSRSRITCNSCGQPKDRSEFSVTPDGLRFFKGCNKCRASALVKMVDAESLSYSPWIKEMMNGKPVRKTIEITGYDQYGNIVKEILK